jgi:5-formyltetrahydrofolate cyclo-ligase
LTRQQIIQKRKSLDSDFQHKRSMEVTSKLLSLPQFHQAINVGMYYAVNGEPATSLIINKIWEAQKNCYLPILNKNEKTLCFIKYQKNDVLNKNQYGILEPIKSAENKANVIDLIKLDFLVTPLVAFDVQGNRLGMGLGFYDKTFAYKKNNKNHKPFMCGLAYEFQKLPEIIPNEWDIPLDCVITEKKIYLGNPKANKTFVQCNHC